MSTLTAESKPDKIRRIAAELDDAIQDLLLQELNKIVLLQKAQRVDAKMKGQKIKIAQPTVMKICREARKSVYEAGKVSH